MAVTVVKRPLGHVLDTTENSACIWDDYGSALVVDPGHGLSDGDYVYIKSNVSNYNGFWYVVYNNGSSFYIREYPTATNAVGVVDTCDVVYKVSILNHGFQCVHLPIVYKLLSDKWPTNNVDTSRTISSITDDNGLCNLNLSGSLGTFDELEYVKIEGNTDFEDEVYQVIDKVSASDITINRAYQAGLSTSGTIILYYNNYTIYVRVYGGLNTSHFWANQKIYELLTTLKITPDSDNIATINIAEILKTKISPTENNTLSPFLPNNLDFYTQFYIDTAETYDDAVSGEVVESTASYTSDQSNFEGSAVNAQLPFKNVHSGYLSEYIYGDENNLIKFLSIFNPVFFTGEYFDISFINNIQTTGLPSGFSSIFRIKRSVYIDGLLKETFFDSIGNRSDGIYRFQVERSGWSEDRIDLTVQASNKIPSRIQDGDWQNNGGSDWSINSSLTSNYTGFGTPGVGSYNYTTNKVVFPLDIVSGTTYQFLVRATIDTSALSYTGIEERTITLYLAFYNSSFVLTDSIQVITLTNTTTSSSFLSTVAGSTGTVTLPATANASYVGFYVDRNLTVSGTYVSGLTNMEAEIFNVICTSEIQDVSETKTITVNDTCSDQDIYLGWLNYLGGFEYWKFTARKDYQYEVEKSKITEKNIYTSWPSSYGEFANSITKQIARNSRKKIVVRSQFLTQEQLEGIKFIRFSPLVQIVEDKYNVTNVVVDSGSFTTFRDAQDMFTLEFTISFTDRIPAQFE